MSATTFWNTGPLDRAVKRWTERGLTSASRHLEVAIESAIDIQGHPLDRRSLPGEAPRFETRDLINSWASYVVPAQPIAYVYSDLARSYVLEYGGRGSFGYVAPRPFIRRTLLAEEPVLADFLTRPMP